MNDLIDVKKVYKKLTLCYFTKFINPQSFDKSDVDLLKSIFCDFHESCLKSICCIKNLSEDLNRFILSSMFGEDFKNNIYLKPVISEKSSIELAKKNVGLIYRLIKGKPEIIFVKSQSVLLRYGNLYEIPYFIIVMRFKDKSLSLFKVYDRKKDEANFVFKIHNLEEKELCKYICKN